MKDVFAEESAGYGLQFTAQRDGKIAVAAVGYADGLPRSLSCGAGEVLIRGKRAPVVGRVCMDQTLIDVTEIPDAEAAISRYLSENPGKKRLQPVILQKRRIRFPTKY